MRLYHFTHKERLPIIEQMGIAKGDVATAPAEGYNAPWFTSDPSWDKQGWQAKNISMFDKSEVRITVDFTSDDPLLRRWIELAKELKIHPTWMRALDETGGKGPLGDYNSSKWYVHHGIVLPERFVKVEYRPEMFKFAVGLSGTIRIDPNPATLMMDMSAGNTENTIDCKKYEKYHTHCPGEETWPYVMYQKYFKSDLCPNKESHEGEQSNEE